MRLENTSSSTLCFPSEETILGHLQRQLATSQISPQEKKIVLAVADYFAGKTESIESLDMMVKIIWNLNGQLKDGIDHQKVHHALLDMDMSEGASIVAIALEACATKLSLPSSDVETPTVDTYCLRIWSHPMFHFPTQQELINQLKKHSATKDLALNAYGLIETIARVFSGKKMSYKEITEHVQNTLEAFANELSKYGRMMVALSLILALKDCANNPKRALTQRG